MCLFKYAAFVHAKFTLKKQNLSLVPQNYILKNCCHSSGKLSTSVNPSSLPNTAVDALTSVISGATIYCTGNVCTTYNNVCDYPAWNSIIGR